MVDDKTPTATLRLDQISKAVLCSIVEENGQWFAIVTEGLAGPLAQPAKIPLELSHLEELKDAPPGSPRYRYRGLLRLPKGTR